MNYDEQIIANIRRLIKASGLKQKHIAELTGCTEQEFSAMLNGRKIIRAVDIFLIAKALNVAPGDILQGQN